MTNLKEKKCVPCEGGAKPLDLNAITALLKNIQNWTFDDQNNLITKTYHFKNYYQTMSFVNAIAWIANQENHHPDLQISYNSCVISLQTHAVGGLSENDFILASKIDALVAGE